MEIERKFLMAPAFPADLPLLEKAEVYQGYIAVHPVVRIRSKRTDGAHGRASYVLCFKGEGTIARQETELDITEEVFLELSQLLQAPMIRKDYRVYALADGRRLECSCVDQGTPTEFWYAEVEFPTLEEAYAFVPPAFLGREVTEEAEYGMSSYWERKVAGLRQGKALSSGGHGNGETH